MVAGIALVVVALLSGAFGIYYWFAASGEVEAIKAMTLCIMAVTSLTGALVIDGIRFYADKLSTQLGYLVRSAKIEASRRSDAGNGQQYRVVGTDPNTGHPKEITVSATDEQAALREGELKGLEVTQVEPTG